MAAKKFYWLKLKRDFFKRHDIRIIEVETKRGKNRYGEETHYAVYRLKE